MTIDTIIEELQKQVYSLDWQIGTCANDLRSGLRNEWDHAKDEKFYSEATNKKNVILETIEKLKTIN